MPLNAWSWPCAAEPRAAARSVPLIALAFVVRAEGRRAVVLPAVASPEHSAGRSTQRRRATARGPRSGVAARPRRGRAEGGLFVWSGRAGSGFPAGPRASRWPGPSVTDERSEEHRVEI